VTIEKQRLAERYAPFEPPKSGLPNPKEELALYFLLVDQIVSCLCAVRRHITEHGRFVGRHSEHVARCDTFHRSGDADDGFGTAQAADVQGVIAFHNVIPPLNSPALGVAPLIG